MGADIHGYLVYKDFKGRNGEQYYDEFANGQLGIDRNYVLFNALAGVRSYDESEPPIYGPRGIHPLLKDAERGIYHIFDDLWYQIVDDEKYEKYKDSEWAHYINQKNADDWRNSGWSRSDTLIRPEAKRSDGTVRPQQEFVSNPDWHSHSFLYADELERVLTKMGNIKVPASSWIGSRRPANLPDGEHRVHVSQLDKFDLMMATNAAADADGMVRVSIKQDVGRFSMPGDLHVEIGDRKPIGAPTEMKALLAAMKAINEDKDNDPEASIFIFWFDN